MSKKEYPYQNLSLKDMKREVWEDIPGLDGYFMISNLGRVKRLEYELIFEDGRVYVKKPQIIKPTLVQSINHFVGDKTYFLRTTLNLFGKTYNFSIARMVYYCFVKPFNFEDKHNLITYNDGNNTHILPSNLKLISMHDLRKRTISETRCENILLRPEIRTKATIAWVKKRGRIISQYNKLGGKIKTFHSIAEAAAVTGLGTSNISGVIQGRKLTAGGFVWRYGKRPKINFEKYLENRKAK